MFDNLRDSSFYEEEQTEIEQPQQARPVARRRKKTRFLGLTAQQRFFLSVMLMFTVVIMGLLAMFVLGKMALF